MLTFKLLLIFALVSSGGYPKSAAAEDWLLVGEHYHTTTDVDYSRDPSNHNPNDSYRREGIAQLLARGGKLGLDAMIVTEHNSVATCFDSLFNERSNKVNLICGEEWTTRQSLHLGLLNPPASSALDSYLPTHPDQLRPLDEVEAEARGLIRGIHESAARTGQTSLVVVNHPGHRMYQPSDSLGADAVEAMVPDYEDLPRARMWWLNQLATGKRMVALGGSDYHACEGWECVKRGDIFRGLFEEPVNLVWAESAASSDVMAAIAKGRVVALSGIRHKNVRVELTADFAGRSYQMGDVIGGVNAGDSVQVHVRIRGAEGRYAIVYGLGDSRPYQVLEAIELETNDFEDTLAVKRTERPQAVHIELFDPADWSGHADALPIALSNPIYF